MKVLLLNPPPHRGVSYVREGRCEQRLSAFQYNMLPVSLFGTAALLRREGHDVRLLDAIAAGLGPDEVLAELGRHGSRLVLMNVSTATLAGDAAVAARVKAASPAFVAAFGVHVTALPGESLRESGFDAVIRREPEVTAAALARALEAGTDLATVEGLSWRAPDGGVRHNTDRPFLADLDALPDPALDLADLSRYPAPLTGEPHALVITSRGCPYGCTFCTAHLYYGRVHRRRDPARIAGEVAAARDRYGLRLFTFWADTFTLDRDHTLALCRELAARGLGDVAWMCNARVDRVDPELLRAMAAAGCRVISFGVESGSQAILDRARKGTRVEQIAPAFAAARAAGIETAAHVILGLPGETPATIRETLRLVRRIAPDYVQFYGAIPFPGTELRREALAAGWVRDAGWSAYELNRCLMDTPQLPARALARWRRRAYLSFYLRPGYLASRLARVRSPRQLARLVRAGAGFLRDWVAGGR